MWQYIKKIRWKAPCDLMWTVGRYELVLPAGHKLPEYQSNHKLYDRFLLHVGEIEAEGLFVDIGANVGDTAAALCQKAGKTAVCVEPFPPFVSYFMRNKVKLEDGNTVHLVSKAVGTGHTTLSLKEVNGTARPDTEGGSIKCTPLDQLMSDLKIKQGPFLVKSDVDGLDAEALLSGINFIRATCPPLYFEMDPIGEEQTKSFSDLFEKLTEIGYRFYVFDNFGLPLTGLVGRSEMLAFLSYINFMYRGKSTRTFYYCDVLAEPPGNDKPSLWVRSFIEHWIR
jgi:FkbM family methyltransferase